MVLPFPLAQPVEVSCDDDGHSFGHIYIYIKVTTTVTKLSATKLTNQTNTCPLLIFHYNLQNIFKCESFVLVNVLYALFSLKVWPN